MTLRRPVIAIAGLSCETSTFSPARTDAAAFHPRRGPEIIHEYPFLNQDTQLGRAASWQGALIGHALPGGIVTRQAFEELAGELLTRLTKIHAADPLDGLWFDIHGAMCVEGLEDVEAELLRRIRQIVGSKVIVSASMDLHGNVSPELARQVDLITCFRTAPHEDEKETKQRACRNLVDLLLLSSSSSSTTNSPPLRPLKAWCEIPILLPGEQTSTRANPAKSLYELLPVIEALPSVIDAALWVGYAWADEPRNHAVVMVTGWDTETLLEQTGRVARQFWDARERFHFAAPTGSLAQCLDAAIESQKRPFFISDSGDNPTAGGAGDVTWSLSRILARPEFRQKDGPTLIYASLPAHHAAESVARAGVGATVTVVAGAEVDHIHEGPITMTGLVHAVRNGDRDALIECVLQIGSVFVILTKLRKPYHHESDFTELNLDARSADIVVVKIGYLEPELYKMAADWRLALTPGGVDQDLQRLGHRHIHRPMWPLDRNFSHPPDLKPRLIPASDQPFSE
ncbi:Microcystinase C [Penicillium ucsense]|uniref:Microcystinase C n=1 Tax=Penicillium ucsense TaxID=2839758 RepID=A0A8J8WL73_9EURO|nr:Microcystinase C [Penicillium ucsense]KAF7734920.1 Microcystinase C [Penicillium ucsense]